MKASCFLSLYFIFIINFVFAQNDTTVIGACDGRFTLGVKSQRLMYGYPKPFSTSHFLVNVDNEIATNRPGMNDAEYLLGNLKVVNAGGLAVVSLITYRFNGIKISQKLIPVDKNLDEINSAGIAQYYRVEYEFVNESPQAKQVGLIMLFDTQIAENDACVMQTCNYSEIQKGGEFLDKVVSLFAFGSQVKERTYEGNDVPQVVLAFRNKKRQKDLTGAFILDQKMATRPDEALVGRWPFYYGVKWEYENPNKKKTNYTDSALLLKWKPKSLNPKDKQRWATYYGLLNPDTLKMIHQMSKLEDATNFKVYPSSIFKGEKAVLKWETKNKLNAEVYISALTGKQANNGKIELEPQESQVYTMKMVLDGKEIGVWEQPLTVLPRNSTTKYDGRFTIGMDTKNLTFGYPYSYSTSHFIVQVEGKQASNYNGLGADIAYIQGELLTTTNQGSLSTQINYEFNGVNIIQKLIPVDKNLKPVESGKFGQYYLIQYLVRNNQENNKEVGLSLMLDLTINKQDGGLLKADNQEISLNSTFTGDKTPQSLFIQTDKNSQEYGELVFNRKEAVKPDEVFVGIWQHLNTAGYKFSPPATIYTNDCAVNLKWKTQTLPAKEIREIATYYGSPQYDKLDVIHHQKDASSKSSVYFESGKFNLTKESISTLEKSIESGKNYAYIVVEGFTDKQGKEDANYQLSQNRVKSVVDFLADKLKIDQKLILTKSHGQFFAAKGAVEDKDRRVTITTYTK
jgi:outer membrane protein OmpA-like peptidoglycan-associated protein